MPMIPTSPGVHIVEIPSGVRTMVGVATSITAFIGRALRGPTNDPVRIQSFADFERQFGGLWEESMLSYAVQHYFVNGGTDAIIIRVVRSAETNPASKAGTTVGGNLNLKAAYEGEWGNNLDATVDYNTKDKDDDGIFNLTIRELDGSPDKNVVRAEIFRNISVDPKRNRFITSVLEQESDLVRVGEGDLPSERPNEETEVAFENGADGDPPEIGDYLGKAADKTGLYALEKADLFNLLCIPPRGRDEDFADENNAAGRDLLSKALAYCKERRAMLIVDSSRTWKKASAAENAVDGLGLTDKNAAIFFPTVRMSDPLKEYRLETFAPCGVVAGIFARTDAHRGVWKAPAGIEATMAGVSELSVPLTDGDNGRLNTLGVNCLRSFPVIGNVVWGSRTLEGADRLASEWKYIPVRRLALFLEESLYRGTQWVVFEPNDEPLWSQIRLNVGAFMHNLFRQGAFQGKSPREAYLVKCDKETTTQNDISLGIVNILVGFAPLKPAEFVIIKIQQLAGQIQT